MKTIGKGAFLAGTDASRGLLEFTTALGEMMVPARALRLGAVSSEFMCKMEWWENHLKVKTAWLDRDTNKLQFIIIMDEEDGIYWVMVLLHANRVGDKVDTGTWSFSTVFGGDHSSLEEADATLEKAMALARMRMLPEVDTRNHWHFEFSPPLTDEDIEEFVDSTLEQRHVSLGRI